MARLALYPNDAGVTLLDEQQILYRQPGFALLEDDHLVTGNAAFARARINPRRIQHRYWSALSAEPLTDRRFEHLTAADIASHQFEECAGAASGSDLVIAVPSYLSSASLGLLLGIAGELNVPVTAMVDSAVAATRREYVNAVPVHIDMGLHSTMLTRLSQAGQASVEQAEVLEDCGVYRLYDTWLNVVAEAFVQQSRFDPLHTAETEQMLLNQLASWIAQAASSDTVTLEIAHAGLTHRAEIESLRMVDAVAPYYQLIASKLRALYRAGEVPALQITDRVARLPGLSELLRARVGGEIFALEAGRHRPRRASKDSRDPGVRWRRQPAPPAAMGSVDVCRRDDRGAARGRWSAHPSAVPTHRLRDRRCAADHRFSGGRWRPGPDAGFGHGRRFPAALLPGATGRQMRRRGLQPLTGHF